MPALHILSDDALDRLAHGSLRELRQALGRTLHPNSSDRFGFSLAMSAAFEGDAERLATLLERGADPHHVDRAGASAAHNAAERDQADCLELLVKAGADLNLLDGDGRSPAWRAASQGSLRALDRLAQLGVDLLQVDAQGRSLAFAAATVWGGPKTLEFLEGRGVNLFTPDAAGQTPLDQAREGGRASSVAFLEARACAIELESVGQGAQAPKPRL